MTCVLIVDDDDAVRAVIARDLARHSYDVLVADSVETAASLLRSAKVDVLLTDLRMTAEADGIDMLEECRRVSKETRAVLMSAYATARDYKRAVELGAVSVLCKPFTPSELVGAIRQAAECVTGFRGSVHGVSLVDILQALHFGRRDVTVSISSAQPAFIHMRKGEILHAEKGEVSGEDAFRDILAASSGAVSTTALFEDVPHTISRSFESLLLDSMRLLDEGTLDGELAFDALASSPPPASGSTPLAERALPLWRPLTELTGRPLANAIAVAFDDDEACALSGVTDGEPYAVAARGIVSAARKLQGGDLVIECACDGVGIGVVASSKRGFALALFDVLPTGSAATWFRSHVAAMARYMLGETSR